MHFPNLHMSAICKLGKSIKHAKGWFFRERWIVKGLKLKVCKLSEILYSNFKKTQQIFHTLAQNTIKAFKIRAQAIFSLLEKTHPLVHKVWGREIFFIILSYNSLFYLFCEIESNFKSVQFFSLHPVEEAY
jgi:hypothetical protein